jgi:hypothetical protein
LPNAVGGGGKVIAGKSVRPVVYASNGLKVRRGNKKTKNFKNHLTDKKTPVIIILYNLGEDDAGLFAVT